MRNFQETLILYHFLNLLLDFLITRVTSRDWWRMSISTTIQCSWSWIESLMTFICCIISILLFWILTSFVSRILIHKLILNHTLNITLTVLYGINLRIITQCSTTTSWVQIVSFTCRTQSSSSESEFLSWSSFRSLFIDLFVAITLS